jgi:hypothetical protein
MRQAPDGACLRLQYERDTHHQGASTVQQGPEKPPSRTPRQPPSSSSSSPAAPGCFKKRTIWYYGAMLKRSWTSNGVRMTQASEDGMLIPLALGLLVYVCRCTTTSPPSRTRPLGRVLHVVVSGPLRNHISRFGGGHGTIVGNRTIPTEQTGTRQ